MYQIRYKWFIFNAYSSFIINFSHNSPNIIFTGNFLSNTFFMFFNLDAMSTNLSLLDKDTSIISLEGLSNVSII